MDPEDSHTHIFMHVCVCVCEKVCVRERECVRERVCDRVRDRVRERVWCLGSIDVVDPEDVRNREGGRERAKGSVRVCDCV